MRPIALRLQAFQYRRRQIRHNGAGLRVAYDVREVGHCRAGHNFVQVRCDTHALRVGIAIASHLCGLLLYLRCCGLLCAA